MAIGDWYVLSYNIGDLYVRYNIGDLYVLSYNNGDGYVMSCIILVICMS